MHEIDDSALFHYSAGYDPEKARQYYLRTRKLKGRNKVGDYDESKGRQYYRQATRASKAPAGAKPNRSKTTSRQAELAAQKEALEKRLDRLRDVLQELVDAAKKRSGVEKKESEKKAAPETQTDKADRNKAEKKSKPETTAEKKERAKKAKEAYEKENPSSLSSDIDILQSQVEDIQAKIKKAVADAQERRNTAGTNDSKSGSKTNNDGPRGR
jgi:DNA repair exonuclease SbcCD ATPase subunit